MIKRRDYRFLHSAKGRATQEEDEGEDARSSGSSSLSDSDGSVSDSDTSQSDADSEPQEEPAPSTASRPAPAAKARQRVLPPEVVASVKGPKGAGADARELGAGKKSKGVEEGSGKDGDIRARHKASRGGSGGQKAETGKAGRSAKTSGEGVLALGDAQAETVQGGKGGEGKKKVKKGVGEVEAPPKKRRKGEERRKGDEMRKREASESEGKGAEPEEAPSSGAEERRGGPRGARGGPGAGWSSQWAEAVEEDEAERALAGHPSDEGEDIEEDCGSGDEERGARGWRRKRGEGGGEGGEAGDGEGELDEESEEALLVLRLGKAGNVLRCRVCPAVVCLNDQSMEAHLVSKKHKAALRRLSQGTLPAMLNSDGELEEDGETHRERLQRVEEVRRARQEGAAGKKNRRRGKGKGRQRQRERKKLKLQKSGNGNDPGGK